MITSYFTHLLILIGIYSILALSLQLAMGFTGLLNLGHIAFYCIGAYTSALLSLHNVPFLICFAAAGVTSMIFGFLLSIPTSKLKGDYLALATLAFSFVTYSVVLNWTSLTRGPMGLPGIKKPSLLNISITRNSEFLMFTTAFQEAADIARSVSNSEFLILTGIVVLATYIVIKRVVNTPFGKVLQAIRDDELAARVLGKNSFKVKSIALAISAFFAGIAGSLYAHYISFIDPSSFTLLQLIPVLAMVIIGGLASLKGTFIATILLVLLPEPLRFIGFPSSMVGPARQIIYALLLLLIMIYKPRGFYGKVELA